MGSCFLPIFGGVIKGLLLVLGPFLLILRLGLGRVGMRAYFLNPISFLFAYCCKHPLNPRLLMYRKKKKGE